MVWHEPFEWDLGRKAGWRRRSSRRLTTELYDLARILPPHSGFLFCIFIQLEILRSLTPLDCFYGYSGFSLRAMNDYDFCFIFFLPLQVSHLAVLKK